MTTNTYLIKEGYNNLNKHGSKTISTMLIICATMLILGIFIIILQNVNQNVQTLLSRQDLAKRWNITPQAILNYEQQGILTRNPNIPTPRYNLYEIERIENMGVGENITGYLQRELNNLRKENRELKEKLNKIQQIIA